MVVRAKFKLVGVRKYVANQWDDTVGQSREMNMADLRFQVVSKTKDPKDENSKFWHSTPTGTIQLQTVNQEAADQLIEHLGGEFYVDFTWVEGTKPSWPPQKSVEETAY